MPVKFPTDKVKKVLALYRQLSAQYPGAMRIFRFVFSGGTATAVNLSVLFALTYFLDLWYVYSSIAAFVVSFFVSFTMQKFWTFEDSSRGRMGSQAFIYICILLFGLGVNTALIYSFVEYADLHYLAAQLIGVFFIAVINYFSYKHLVFAERLPPAIPRERITIFHTLLLIAAVAFLLFVALFRLAENPPTWLDEGSIVQVSVNVVQSGVYGLQTAPGEFISTDFLTTGYPVIYPVAVALFALGIDITNARIVMVLFLLCTCLLAYLLMRKVAIENTHTIAIASLLLLATFAPLYGHGKNVLGEVPGLTFFLASLLVLWYAQRKDGLLIYTLSGVLLGLSMATKPIYLFILAPASLLMLLIAERRPRLSELAAYTLGASAMLLAWFLIQVKSISALQQLAFAANAANVPLLERIADNSVQFMTQLQPAYFLSLVLLWSTSLIYRRLQGIQITDIEKFAIAFTIANLLLYIVSRGFYRYFFAAEALALIFLPLALLSMPVPESYRKKRVAASYLLLALLIGFQAYQTLFRSWISEHRHSQRTELLSRHMGSLPESSSVFLYNVPEAAIFLPTSNYYQYLDYGDNVRRGQEGLMRLYEGVPDFVLVDEKFLDAERILPLYKEKAQFDKYTLYEKI